MPLETEDYMCPNCVTPWKCNGPHLMEETMTNWRMLHDDQKAEIAVELFTELLNEADEHTMTFGEPPEYWKEKDVKAMKRTLEFLASYYGFSSLD